MPQFPANLVTFTEEILNGKIHFLCNANLPFFIFLLSLTNYIKEVLIP